MTDRRHGGKSFLNCKNPIANTGIYSIQSDDHLSRRLVAEVQRLQQQNLFAFVRCLLLCRDDVTYDPRDDHGRVLWISSTIATIVASVGTSSGLNANAASRP